MELSKLKWRCRRGIKEFDILFGHFVETEYSKLNTEQQAWFHSLLDQQDPMIMDWLLKRSEPEDDGLKWIIERLQNSSDSFS